MFFKILILSQLIWKVSLTLHKQTCLTGYMTDVQSWVNEIGALTPYVDPKSTIDVSKDVNPIQSLEAQIHSNFKSRRNTVKYLSMAKCSLEMVPQIDTLRDSSGRNVTMTVQYYTLYGNNFGTQKHHLEPPPRYRSNWALAFKSQSFRNLIELDLRNCFIEEIDNGIFKNMPNLKVLYLGENKIHMIKSTAFYGLPRLQYLDISRQMGDDNAVNLDKNVFKGLTRLKSLDFSFTKLHIRSAHKIFQLGPSFKKLSLCNSKLNMSVPFMFNSTSLEILDVSGNLGILTNTNIFQGVKSTLNVIYAKRTNLKSFQVFHGLSNLQILKISKNDLSFIRPDTAQSLKNLQVLDINSNRFSTWFEPTFSLMPNLMFLSLRGNNINYISDVLMDDLKNISYISLADNFVVCNCYAKEFLMLAYENEQSKATNRLQTNLNLEEPKEFHNAIKEFSTKVDNRIKVTESCEEFDSCDKFIYKHKVSTEGRYVIYDYNPQDYECLLTRQGTYVSFVENPYCDEYLKYSYEDVLDQNTLKLLFLLLIIPILGFAFIMRKKIRFFCLTVRNSTLLTMMEQPIYDVGTLYNYDVFVSYSNEDRPWVLDNFLPQVERESGISVCLHERDFQVGLSILENIVSCMDRSRCIILLLSQQFLLSRWCQFEMHLAQHRLLETRREDLILILLEDIPRKLRPNTLHYLMMTKTYIVWPKEKDEQKLFWVRLKRSLVTQKMKYMDNISLV